MEFADKKYVTGYELQFGKPVCDDARIPSLFNLCVNKLRRMGLNLAKMSPETLRIFLSPTIPEIVIDDIYFRSIEFKRVKKTINYVEEYQLRGKMRLKGRIMTIKEECILSDCNTLIDNKWKVERFVEIISRKIKKIKFKLRCQVLFYDDEWDTYEECARSKDLVYLPGFNKIICGKCIEDTRSKELLFGSE